MLEDSGFERTVVGPPVDTFGGAIGEANARSFDVYGYAFLAERSSQFRRCWPVSSAAVGTRDRTGAVC